MTRESDEDIHAAFIRGDCWVLALEMSRRYEGLEPCVLAGEGLEWIHMLVEDTRTGHFVDANGVQTFDEVQANWDDYFWTGIEPFQDMHIQGMVREYPHIDPQQGIDLILRSTDWTEPARRVD